MNTQVVILGMHRTASSFVANWLHDCGLFLGYKLLEPSKYNAKGYFEDIEFLEFHQSVFLDRGMDKTGLFYSTPIEQISCEDIIKATELIKKRDADFNVWGLKEPRTCLLINNLYDGAFSNPFYILTIRKPLDVVDSILRREFSTKAKGFFFRLLDSPKRTFFYYFIYPNMILKAWINYNLELVKLVNKGGGYIVLNHEVVLSKHREIIDFMTSKGVTLNWKNPNEIFSAPLIKQSKINRYYFISKKIEKEAEQLHNQLESLLF